MISVRLSPTFSADWPNFAAWTSSFRAVNAATATRARCIGRLPARIWETKGLLMMYLSFLDENNQMPLSKKVCHS
jgi:hypothetical protein